jgi:hypothetical protein
MEVTYNRQRIAYYLSYDVHQKPKSKNKYKQKGNEAVMIYFNKAICFHVSTHQLCIELQSYAYDNIKRN